MGLGGCWGWDLALWGLFPSGLGEYGDDGAGWSPVLWQEQLVLLGPPLAHAVSSVP